MNSLFFNIFLCIDKQKRASLTLVFLLTVSALVFSANLKAESSELYALPIIGGLLFSTENIENIQIVGITVGYRFANAFYVETELNTSVSGGEFENTQEKGKLNFSNFNVYGVYRYVWNKRVYSKLKLGVAYKSLKYDTSNTVGVANDEDSFGAAAGLGVGLVFSPDKNPFMLEIDYAVIDKDISMITVGMTFPF
ncbi:MAG: outer membrane beta-barrel protein [Thiohalomonadales bacterium]